MFDALVLFIKIVKLGSFVEASKSLGLSPSSLTRKIQKLEKDLNLILLKRDTRTLELSTSGMQLFDKYCNLEPELEKVLSNIEKDKNEISGQINILLPPFFALKIITPYLVDFLIKNPKISLNISYQNRQTNLLKENFDLAIINHRPQQSTQKIKLLCRSKIVFYCYPDYIKKFGIPTTQQQVEDNLIIGVMLDHKIPEKITYLINKKSGQKIIFNHTYRIIQNSGSHDQELAQTGLTIGAGMDIMMRRDIESRAVIQILPDFYLPGFEYYLLINPEGKNARTQVFIEFINDCIKKLNLNENLEMI